MAFRRRRPEPEVPSEPELTPLSLSDSQWRSQQLEVARIIVERYCGDAALPPSLAQLDATITAWHADGADRVEINAVANAVGVTFGHHLAQATGLTWVLATDEKGSELALHRAEGNVLVYPCNLVAKRLVDDERDFVEPLHAELVASIRQIPS